MDTQKTAKHDLATMEKTENTIPQFEISRNFGEFGKTNRLGRSWTLVRIGNKSDELCVSEEVL